MCCVNANWLYRGPDIRGMKDHKTGLFWPSQYCGCVLLSLPFPWLDSKQSYNILPATQSKGEWYMAITSMDNTVPRISLRAATLLYMHSHIDGHTTDNCPGILRKRWQAETSWFFAWKLLELVVQFREDMKQVLLSKASNAVWELLEYILIFRCDLSTL